MKKFVYLLVILTLLSVLGACGNNVKNTYVEAYEGLTNAKSYETTSTITFEMAGSETPGAPDEQMMFQLFNNAELKMVSRMDTERELAEAVVHIKASQAMIPFDLEIPMHMNLKEQKVYIKTETMLKALTMGPFPASPSDFSFEKEFIALDAIPEGGAEKQQQMEQQMQEQMKELLSNLPQDSFKESENGIELNLDGEQIKPLITSYMGTAMAQSGEVFKGANEQELEKALEAITINKAQIKAEIEDGKLNKENITFEMEARDGEESGRIKVSAITEYKNINEDVTFTMNPTAENTMTEKEFQEELNKIMMESMMTQ